MKIQTTLEKFEEGLWAIKQNGGTVDINPLDTTIEGTAKISGVSAEFEFNQGELTIKITDKPWLASEEMVEDKIKEFFQETYERPTTKRKRRVNPVA